MKCAICGNEHRNESFIVKEMMFGFKEEFRYFQCHECSCFQIEQIPANMDKYYPDNYYSIAGTNERPLKLNYFKHLQYDHLSGHRRSIAGAIASYKYNPSTYNWFKNLELKTKRAKVLDVGCGNGKLLKQLYQAGFKDLTGVDPYVKEDKTYNNHLRILKKSVFELQGCFDLIMMHHSLEHIPDHYKVLSRLHQLLHEKGKMLIRIPIMSDLLFAKYGVNMVCLDAPRHFYIHSIQSISNLLTETGFVIKKKIYDAELFDIIGSEQYVRGISIHDPRSYAVNKKESIFTPETIAEFKRFIEQLNKEEKSCSVALYIERAVS